MMTNGSLKVKTFTGGGFEANGDPKAVVPTWSDPIDALIIPNSNGRLTKYQDGEQVTASYTIHLESQVFDFTRIQITNDRGTELGEYEVLRPNIRFLDTSGRVVIIV